MSKVSIVSVEDEVLIRKGVKYILQQEDNFEIVKEFDNGEVFVNYINESKKRPDIVLMDVEMPKINGIEATKQLISSYPDFKTIALSNYNSNVFIKNMLEVGAVSYLPKRVTPKVLFDTINKVVENGFYYDKYIIDFVLDKTKKVKLTIDNDDLTAREKDVLNLICKQKSATEIGEILHVSSRAVDGHRNNLLLKTESKNVFGLVMYAIKNNLFSFAINF